MLHMVLNNHDLTLGEAGKAVDGANAAVWSHRATTHGGSYGNAGHYQGRPEGKKSFMLTVQCQWT